MQNDSHRHFDVATPSPAQNSALHDLFDALDRLRRAQEAENDAGAPFDDATRKSGILDDYESVVGLARATKGKVTEPKIRWALRYRDENGLAEHVVRMGRQLLINVPGFMQWLKSRRV